jgi:hypothetical protein
MPIYPQLAREITDLRKRGDLDGAIARFKAAPEGDRRLPEVRVAVAWVIYDRDIKPCSARDIDVTDIMVDTAVGAVWKIRTWCDTEPNGQFSAYPTALLAVAKLLKEREEFDRFGEILDTDDGPEFSTIATGDYPSSRDRWVQYVLDFCKYLLKMENATQTRFERAKPFIDRIAKIESRRGLSNKKPQIEVQGRMRTAPSPQQRFYLQASAYFMETEHHEEAQKLCREALRLGVFSKDPNRKWILHRYTRALLRLDPSAALGACEEFISLEYKPYALMLKAEILLALGRTEDALRQVAHSLQIITDQDLPYITGNLMMLARLASDPTVKRAHVQMVRTIRAERGWGPSTDVETLASELGLGPDEPDPNPAVLRDMWNSLNPNPLRPTPTKTDERLSREELNEFLREIGDRGKVGLVLLPDKEGQKRHRPVVVVGSKADRYLVGMLQSSSKHRQTVPIREWQLAGLKQPTVFVPYYVPVKKKDLAPIGRLTETDLEKLPRAGTR